MGMKFGVPEPLIAEYLELIGQDAIVAEFEELPDLPIQDRDDAEIVAAAIGARAEVLVTGDHELQSLKNVGQAKDYFPESLLGRTDGPGIEVWCVLRTLGPRQHWRKIDEKGIYRGYQKGRRLVDWLD